ncbi:unnamed protein product [Angiostrongylus costaricensis]|uniref:poly(A)-specific ribonuclease n=1 Tax=Angiostrongylus costaricensis TaxID=334426 RepID=A0A0R3PYQ9_ANGCS|nr:unnamed protein product [Angiostrongylus costaricensis]
MQNGELNGSEEYKDKQGGGAGLPLTKVENNDGKKVLTNGMSRVHRILSEDEINQGKTTRWTELEIHGRVRNLSNALWQVSHLSALFLNGNQLTRVPPEISQLTNLTMLDLSHNKLRSLPAELGLQGNPLSPEINKIYHESNGSHKLLHFLHDHLAINTAPPPEREWVMIRHADPDRPIATFTVLCYNVLCDKYATVNQYSYCPSWALNWEYRKMSIMKEIRNYEADIITLQEVETEQFRLLFQPELKMLGYSGIFSPKSRAKTMNEEDRKYVDGCAIFWKSEKFEMDREHLIEFTQVVVKKASTSEHMLNRVMPRDNIALCAVLRIKENVYNNRRMTMAAADNVVGTPLVVCTAHIHWDPELCDVKLIQTMMLAHELYKLLEEVAEQFRITPQQTPVLICGDLNSLPDSGMV